MSHVVYIYILLLLACLLSFTEAVRLQNGRMAKVESLTSLDPIEVVKLMLKDCKSGVGTIASFQSVCNLIQQVIDFSNGDLVVISLSRSSDCLTGSVDTTKFFPGVNTPGVNSVFSFKACKPSGNMLESAGLRFESVTFSLSKLLGKMKTSSLSFGPFINNILASVGLGDISLQINTVGVNVSPYGFLLSGSIMINGRATKFSLVLWLLGSANTAQNLFGVALDVEFPVGGFNDFITKALGPAAPMLQVFVFDKDFHLALSSNDIDLSSMPAFLLETGAFGLSKLSIGNVAGEIGLTLTPPWLYLLALGGQIRFGDASDPNPIVGTVYFKINLHDPNENYFYGSISKVSIEDIWVKILGQTSQLPKFLGESGFDDGLTISYALLATTTPSGDDVPNGLRVKGGINLFGFKARADIRVNPLRVKLFAEFSPVSIGFLRISRSENNVTAGPTFLAEYDINPTTGKMPSLNVNIEGYVKDFTFEAYVKIVVDSSQFSFEADGPMFGGLLFGHIKIVASRTSKFTSFEASVKMDNFRAAIRDLGNALRNAGNAALDKAREGVNYAKKKLDDVKCNIEIASAQESFIELNSGVKAHLAKLSDQFEALKLVVSLGVSGGNIQKVLSDSYENMNANFLELEQMSDIDKNKYLNIAAETEFANSLAMKSLEESSTSKFVENIVVVEHAISTQEKELLDTILSDYAFKGWESNKFSKSMAKDSAIIKCAVNQTHCSFLESNSKVTRGFPKKLAAIVSAVVAAARTITTTVAPCTGICAIAAALKAFAKEQDSIVSQYKLTGKVPNKLLANTAIRFIEPTFAQQSAWKKFSETRSKTSAYVLTAILSFFRKVFNFDSTDELKYRLLTPEMIDAVLNQELPNIFPDSYYGNKVQVGTGFSAIIRTIASKFDPNLISRNLLSSILKLKYYKSEFNFFIHSELTVHGAPRLHSRLSDMVVPVVKAVNAGVTFGKIFKCNFGGFTGTVDFSTELLANMSLGKGLATLEKWIEEFRTVRTAQWINLFRVGTDVKKYLQCTLDATDAYIAFQYVNNPEQLKREFIHEAYDYYMAHTPPPPRDCSGWSFFSCAVDDVKDSFSSVGTWISKTAKAAWEETREIGLKAYDGLKTAGCTLWDGTLDLLKKGLDVAVSFLELCQKAIAGLFRLLDMILESIGNIELGLSVKGQLDVQKFDFMCDLLLKLPKVGIDWKWSMQINFKLNDLLGLAKLYWSKIKIWIFDQVPGLNALL